MSSTTQRWGITAVIVIIIVAAGAYYLTRPQQPPAPEVEEPEVEEPEVEEPEVEKTLIIGTAYELDYMDPSLSSQTEFERRGTLVYDTLVTWNDDFSEHLPLLAKSWEVSEDGLTWTFHLREDVTFHCGEPFNAEAVVYKWERYMSPDIPNPTRSFFEPCIDWVEAVDEYTVVFHMKQPWSFFLGYMSTVYAAPVCPKCAEEWGIDEFTRHACGTGPYKMTSWTPGDKLEMERFEDYNWAPAFAGHEGPANIHKVVWREILEPETLINEALTGGVDMVQSAPWSRLGDLMKEEHLTVITAPAFSIYAVRLNCLPKSYYGDVRVRRAVAHAIDRQELIDGAVYGFGTPEYSVLTPQMDGYVDFTQDEEFFNEYLSYDLTKAGELLDEAGWELADDGWRYNATGHKLAPEMWTWDYPHYRAISTIVKEQLKEIGIDVQIKVYDRATMTAGRRAGKHDMDPAGWDWWSPDIVLFLYPSWTVGIVNTMFYNTTTLDNNMLIMQNSTDPIVYAQAAYDVQREIAENVPMVRICVRKNNIILSQRVKNFQLVAYPPFCSWVWTILDVEE